MYSKEVCVKVVCVCLFWCSCISSSCASHIPHFACIRFLNVSHKTVDEGDVFAGVDVGCKAIGVGNITAGAGVVDVGHEAIAVGCEVINEDNTITGAATSPLMSMVTSSPSAALASLVTCSWILAAFTLFFKSPKPLALST